MTSGPRSQYADQRASQRRPPLVAPGAVGIQPLEAVKRRLPFAPRQLALGRIGVRRDAETAQPRDVLDHVARLAGQTVGRLSEAERDVVAAGGADLDGVDQQHAVDVAWRRRRRVPSPWSVSTTKSRPARAAAAATSSGVPAPSETVVWTWMRAAHDPCVRVEGQAGAAARRQRQPRPRTPRAPAKPGTAATRRMRVYGRGWKRSWMARSRASSTCV